ncbi:SH3 domain-containing protein [Corallococcus sp. AS-1-12]|uniref:SH3 domain-containing protein n=1 Tax=Corallococcus sp. AS-1-12 TaxID=2874598 RepID=UPI001CBAA538|nr:SH3 domain-containing protein [Corallococcus sp. AS-1-12]MBZ4336061.1 SH3 domain-containing protein [Corallococcus sp. AS-1-12]
MSRLTFPAPPPPRATARRTAAWTWRTRALLLAVMGASANLTACAAPSALAVSPSGVPAFSEDMLTPEFWIRRAPSPDAVLLDAGQVAAKRMRAFAPEGGLLDLKALPATLTRAQVAGWVGDAQRTPIQAVIDEQGRPVTEAMLEELRQNAAAGQIPETSAARYGLSVRRTHLRSLPSDRRLFASEDLRDYESLQAGVLFPGEPVVIAHTSADQQWLFVQTTQGPAWVKRGDIAEGTADAVFSYVAKEPGRVVTGDQVRTVFTPEAPEVSELELDMGVALPRADVAPGEPVNGASSYASWPVLLPVRAQDGSLAFQSALLRRTADTAPGHLPLTRANILRQSFKFLGERYGWGHQFNARDCSGLTSEVYRGMGLLLAPNSGLQGRSAALNHRLFTARDSHAERVRALRQAEVGDLVVVPGHVLMIIGHVDGEPYVIQDVPFAVFKDPATRQLRKTKLNQVSVTPLLPLYADDTTLYVDAMTSLVHVTRP